MLAGEVRSRDARDAAAGSRVYVIDDDEDVRAAIVMLLDSSGMIGREFQDGDSFLKAIPELEPGCVVLDMRLPGKNGVEVLAEMRRRDCSWPVIIITGHAQVTVAVQAMKLGAVDFLEKPFRDDELLSAVEMSLAFLREQGEREARVRRARALYESLTERERMVFDGLRRGKSNKVMAAEWGLSYRTVEMHRAKMMARLCVRDLTGVLAIAHTLGLAVDTGGDPDPGEM